MLYCKQHTTYMVDSTLLDNGLQINYKEIRKYLEINRNDNTTY